MPKKKCSPANGRRLAMAHTRPNDCELYGYCKGNEYLTPSEIDTFHSVVVTKQGIGLFPNGTNPTPLVYDRSLNPTDQCLEQMEGRHQFVYAIAAAIASRAYLQKIVR